MLDDIDGTPRRRLQAKLELAWPMLQLQAQRLWGSSYVRQVYPEYLKTMHGVVRSAVHLMEKAIEACQRLPDSDPLKAPLIHYFSKHMEEERGHDIWILEDYEATGGNRADVLQQMPSALMASFVGAQYYWMFHYHPITLVGHIAALEGYHPPLGFAQRLSELTQYPMEAFRAIARHEKLDITHRRELYAFIDDLPLSKTDEKAMGLSGLHTMKSAAEVLSDLCERSEAQFAGTGWSCANSPADLPRPREG